MRQIAHAAGWLLVGLVLLATGNARADHYRDVGGVEIYLGVIPSALIAENVNMHDGYARKEGHYHLTVALFDEKSGARLTDARVEAEVAPVGLENSNFKILEPMIIAGTTTFGNYFQMRLHTVYHIHVRVQLPNRSKTLTALFEYDLRES